MTTLSSLLARKRRQLEWRVRLHLLAAPIAILLPAASLAFAILLEVHGNLAIVLESAASAGGVTSFLSRLVNDQWLELSTTFLTAPTVAVVMYWRARRQKICFLLAQILEHEGDKDTAVRVLLTSLLDGDPGSVGLPSGPAEPKTGA